MTRSYLYAPGDRPDRFERALTSGADTVIFDLEDGVAPSKKTEAASNLPAMLTLRDTIHAGNMAGTAPRVVVRVNAESAAADCSLALSSGVNGIVLPKATPGVLDSIAETFQSMASHPRGNSVTTTALHVELIALIESAAGLLAAAQIAAHPLVTALALGEADLFSELRITPSAPSADLASIRIGVVVAAAAAGLRAPTAPVSTNFSDLDQFAESCAYLRSLGFGARSAIHPAQIPIINECFRPTQLEIARARELVADFDASVAAGRGVIVGEDGTMIDEAVVRSARMLLEQFG